MALTIGSEPPDPLGSVQIFLFELVGDMNIRHLQTMWAEIDIFIRNVGWSEDDLSCYSLKLPVTDCEQSVALTYDKDLIIRMFVQPWSAPDMLGGIKHH